MADIDLRLKIRLVDPPLNYAYCLQRGKGAKGERLDYVEILTPETKDIEFELNVIVRRAKNGPEPDFFGPFVQGPIGTRFFYLCVGHVVERSDPQWTGRVKVPFTGIDWPTIDAAVSTDRYLCGSYQASGPGGRPVLASVKLLDDGWAVQ
ncbi:MAG: hypothetical protein J4G19_06710 [Pseudomonadales bacterium]|nr:hypothetical protein [Pseudomonadales bacterium]